MKGKRVIALLFALSFAFILGCADENTPLHDCEITDLSFCSGLKSEVELKVGKTESGYFKVEYEGEYALSDIVFSNSAPDVVSFEYDKTVLGTYIYYNVKALSPGEAVISLKTSDGIVQSEEIKVIVIGETTKEPEATKVPDDTQRTYILNTSTKKYHIEGCSSAKRIKDSNRDTFVGTPAELESMGYAACQNCH